MIEEYHETSRKRIFVLLFLLILLGVLAIYFAIHTTTGPNTVVAEQGNVADANQLLAEPNEPSIESNQPPSEPNKPSVEPNQPSAEPNQPPAQKLEDPNDKKVLRPTHRHLAYTERIAERSRMVNWQIEARNIKDPNVLSAMRTVPRHVFVRSTEQRSAYTDNPLPLNKS